MSWFGDFACAIAHWTGRPIAFGLAVVIVLAWAAVGPYFDWSEEHQLWINTGTTIITFLMVFLIQAQQNRWHRPRAERRGNRSAQGRQAVAARIGARSRARMAAAEFCCPIS
jgi:phosphatidylserine synthase